MSQSAEKVKFSDSAGYVGFANLPNQVHRKSVKKGFEFTLMVVGESGLGKSTLINSLFLTDLYPERYIPGAGEKIERTVQIEASTVEIEERGVKLRLTVVDTPGYGDAINSQNCFKTIIHYIDNQFERYLHDESGLNRRHIVDNRVHCCFYFISPFGHGLKPLDVEFMKAIHGKVNIVPVIAKADTLTLKERERLKRRESTWLNSCDLLFRHPCWFSRHCFGFTVYHQDLCSEKLGFLNSLSLTNSKLANVGQSTHVRLFLGGSFSLATYYENYCALLLILEVPLWKIARHILQNSCPFVFGWIRPGHSVLYYCYFAESYIFL
uniref:Septin-type G domain-containing protein n=1 Tax=Naja naja TaxID=35670 RepID=A0A8C6XP73_NAJNA